MLLCLVSPPEVNFRFLERAFSSFMCLTKVLIVWTAYGMAAWGHDYTSNGETQTFVELSPQNIPKYMPSSSSLEVFHSLLHWPPCCSSFSFQFVLQLLFQFLKHWLVDVISSLKNLFWLCFLCRINSDATWEYLPDQLHSLFPTAHPTIESLLIFSCMHRAAS